MCADNACVHSVFVLLMFPTVHVRIADFVHELPRGASIWRLIFETQLDPKMLTYQTLFLCDACQGKTMEQKVHVKLQQASVGVKDIRNYFAANQE